MSQCLHCGKPCTEHAVFCEECQKQARDLFQEKPEPFDIKTEFSPLTPPPLASPPAMDGEETRGAVTVSFEPASPSSIVVSSTDQAFSRLDAAARWIATEEPSASRLKRSASRLTPLRDISAEIQRGSTPHPFQQRRSDFDTQPETELGSEAAEQVRVSHSSSIWSWSGDAEEEEKDSDVWANATDPFLARRRPTADEAASIEAADIRRVQFEEQITLPLPDPQVRQKRRFSRWHVAFASMVVLAIVALAIDSSLLSFAFRHAGRSPLAQGGPPTLLLSTSVANPGDQVSLQLSHFTPRGSVVLTHDVQETLMTTKNQAMLLMNSLGASRATFIVSASWGPGFHLIVAEDVTMRTTASAMLQISGAGPSHPPHLIVEGSTLDLGDAVQGADTIRSLQLRNSGDGEITWSASTDQSWLLVAPVQGVFSAGQNISVGVERNNLPPGTYSGTITISSTVGAPETVQVSMKVSALPPNAGPMISLVPPLLAFTATDGSTVPQTQVMTLSNPGQSMLYWSLNTGSTTSTALESTTPGPNTLSTTWVRTDVRSGSLAPGASQRISVTVFGQSLLPGSYMLPITFSADQALGAYDTPQVMQVFLTIQPHCGLLTSTGNLDFTAVMGQSNPGNRALGLSSTSSCGNSTLDWQAFSSTPWLVVGPQNGQLKGANTGVASIGVNTTGLTAGKYEGLVTFQADKSTQTVVVRLNLQPHPAPSAPIMQISPLSLNFSTIQGQPNPAGQVVTIANNGGSALRWRTNVVLMGTSWLNVAPTGGYVDKGNTDQTTVTVNTSKLTPGTYTGQVSLVATDERGLPVSGSPQTVTVSLTVQPPCTLAQPSTSSLLFTATAGGANPLAQTVTLTGSGSCVWPVHWSASVAPAASWLNLSATTGSLTTLAQQSSLSVGVNASGLQPGTYTTQVTISAKDSAGMAANQSPQSFSVTLTVLQPCTLKPVSGPITLNVAAGQSAAVTQTISLNESGSCNGGVSWTAVGDAGSKAWLSISPASGTDTGSGSTLTISASAGQLAPGNYTGQITISANNNGVVLQGSPQTIQVTLQINGYTVSGSALACGGPSPSCTTSQALAGATVTLMSGSTVVATTTADSSGNFSFSNVSPGSYTLNATGMLSTVAYSGSASVNVMATVTGVSISTFSS